MLSSGNNKIWKILFIIFLISGAVIRINGIFYGNPPTITLNEEARIFNIARDMIYFSDPNPHYFNYPTFFIYLQSFVYFLLFHAIKLWKSVENITDVDPWSLYIAGRTITFLFSMLTIYYVYKIAKLFLPKKIAVVSVVYLTFCLLHIQNSAMIAVDSPMAFLVLIGFYYSLKIWLKDATWKNYILAGAFIGLAVSTKYNAFLMIIPLIFAHLLKHSDLVSSLKDNKIYIALALVPITFLLTTPYSLLDFSTFIQNLNYESIHYRYGHLGAESNSLSYFNYGQILLEQYGYVPVMLAVLGIILLYKKNSLLCIFLISFPITYFVFIGSFKVFFARNMVALIPFLSLFGAYSIFVFYEYLSGKLQNEKGLYVKRIIFTVLLLVILSQGIVQTVNYLHIINLTDTRIIAKQWLRNNLPKEACIAYESYTPVLNGEFKNAKQFGFIGKIMTDIKSFDYIVMSSSNYERFLKDNKRLEMKKKYLEIMDAFILVKEIKSDHTNTAGPTIRIYKNPL